MDCESKFKINSKDKFIKVFTTRPDTIFGASFIALSADHPISESFKENKSLRILK